MCQQAARWLAHSDAESGRKDTLAGHLADVARRAAEYATAFGASQEAWATGLLHDIGKYGELFQKRLRGEEHGVDHWSLGAWIALKKWQTAGIAAALAIQGHHVGLKEASQEALCNLGPDKLKEAEARGLLRLSEADPEVLLARLSEDGFSLPPNIPASVCTVWNANQAAAMLDVRMLFSALVDADFVETEAHFRSCDLEAKYYRPAGPPLYPERALEAVLAYIDNVARTGGASEGVKKLRQDLLEACLAAAEEAPGLFTLTAPTGAGKTLSMLAFALKHAARHRLRRVVCVIPYLTIIEQTVEVYREALRLAFDGIRPEVYVLEDHSLAGTGAKDEKAGQKADGSDEMGDESRLLAEDWDAPLVVTTSVQFLESLFANRPAPCRKLHRLANSVVLFDEVQTLPTHLAVATLATLSHLAERYGATVVFSTATQPAFQHLDEAVKQYCASGWRPREIVPPALNLFARAARTRVFWPTHDSETLSWSDVAARLEEAPQALCVVNLKRHALALFWELGRRRGDQVHHLSTSMCPAHRMRVLEEVRRRLGNGEPCLLVSTQCVEAGVDVDFPLVYRAWGPLDAIAQAAGRCNREGLAGSGDVYVFHPERDAGRNYPDTSYEQAAAVAWAVLQEYGPQRMDIHDPSVFDSYYRRLYDVKGLGQDRGNDLGSLTTMIRGVNFERVAHLYKVIEQNTINVVVPYCREVFEELAERARSHGLTREWILRARPYTVGIYRPRHDDRLRDWLEPVPVGRQRCPSEEWFLYLGGDYDERTGLTPKDRRDLLIA